MQEIQLEPTAGRVGLIASALYASIHDDVLVAASVGGVHGALAHLNARTRNRFTGICPSAADAGFAPYLYDRDNPGCRSADLRDLLRVSSASDDHWPTSLLAAPIVGTSGLRVGMLCHFDSRLRTSPPIEEMILRFIGERAAAWLYASPSTVD